MNVNYKYSYYHLSAFIVFMFLFIIGSTMNFLAVSHNEGRMPFPASYIYKSDSHIAYQDKSEVNYWYLSDIIPIKNMALSPGDIILYLSVFLLIGTTAKMFLGKTRMFRR